MKQFEVPIIYRSPLISAIKKNRKAADKLKKDFSPALLDFGPLQIFLARHFGFCYGVENAIEIAFRTVEENPGKKIYLLSEMIHNPQVNEDLRAHGVEFLQDTYGKPLLPFDKVTADDIVLIPAFGTTLEMENRLKAIGIAIEKYDTTCPFVEKVWNRSEAIASRGYTIVIHGKPGHEETRATFSHAAGKAAAIVVRDMGQARLLAAYIKKEKPAASFFEEFKGQYSEGFDPGNDLRRIGVVNQTTMLASDTQAIADYLKQTILSKYPAENFADTRDTLCYATNDNQTAVTTMLETPAELAIVVGGYNSSNTSHLVELLEKKLPTYFINSAEKIISPGEILHFNIIDRQETSTKGFLPESSPVRILLTSGASCPDALVEGVIKKLESFFKVSTTADQMTERFAELYNNS